MSEVQPLTAKQAEELWDSRPVLPNGSANLAPAKINQSLYAIAEGRHRVYDASTCVALPREDVKQLLIAAVHELGCLSDEQCTCGLTERLERVRGMMAK